MKRRWRFYATLLATCAVTMVVAAVAYATYFVTYGGPKTWLPGYAAHGNYDYVADRWGWNEFANRSINSWARVVLIDAGGTWHATYECFGVYCGRGVADPSFQKKPYCDNTDTISYTGRCNGERGY